MSIFLDSCLITSAPIAIQLALCEFFFTTAAILFCLSAEAGYYPRAREHLRQYLRADYWITRQRRKHLAYRLYRDPGCLEPGAGKNGGSRNRAGKVSPLHPPRGFYPHCCTCTGRLHWLNTTLPTGPSNGPHTTSRPGSLRASTDAGYLPDAAGPGDHTRRGPERYQYQAPTHGHCRDALR